jgi:hypothetical protein
MPLAPARGKITLRVIAWLLLQRVFRLSAMQAFIPLIPKRI